MPVKKHDCIQNWDRGDSSKSMEATEIICMVINCVLLGFIIRSIISDSDNIMRAHLKYVSITQTKYKGNLPKWIREPEFLADPRNCKKFVVKKNLQTCKCKSIKI